MYSWCIVGNSHRSLNVCRNTWWYVRILNLMKHHYIHVHHMPPQNLANNWIIIQPPVISYDSRSNITALQFNIHDSDLMLNFSGFLKAELLGNRLINNHHCLVSYWNWKPSPSTPGYFLQPSVYIWHSTCMHMYMQLTGHVTVCFIRDLKTTSWSVLASKSCSLGGQFPPPPPPPPPPCPINICEVRPCLSNRISMPYCCCAA